MIDVWEAVLNSAVVLLEMAPLLFLHHAHIPVRLRCAGNGLGLCTQKIKSTKAPSVKLITHASAGRFKIGRFHVFNLQLSVYLLDDL